MQEVSKFFGLVVRMEYEEDAVPFVHINYEASKGISYYAKVSVSRHRVIASSRDGCLKYAGNT